MKKFKDQSLKKYLECLSLKTPTPGGGSAAALAGALGCALISMVARYSVERARSSQVRKKIKTILKESDGLRRRLLELVDLDAEAYLKVVEARRGNNPQRMRTAKKAAAAVPAQVAQLCYKAVALIPFLVKEGNRYLLSDLEVAAELLEAAFQSSRINVEINQ